MRAGDAPGAAGRVSPVHDAPPSQNATNKIPQKCPETALDRHATHVPHIRLCATAEAHRHRRPEISPRQGLALLSRGISTTEYVAPYKPVPTTRSTSGDQIQNFACLFTTYCLFNQSTSNKQLSQLRAAYGGTEERSETAGDARITNLPTRSGDPAFALPLHLASTALQKSDRQRQPILAHPSIQPIPVQTITPNFYTPLAEPPSHTTTSP